MKSRVHVNSSTNTRDYESKKWYQISTLVISTTPSDRLCLHNATYTIKELTQLYVHKLDGIRKKESHEGCISPCNNLTCAISADGMKHILPCCSSSQMLWRLYFLKKTRKNHILSVSQWHDGISLSLYNTYSSVSGQSLINNDHG